MDYLFLISGIIGFGPALFLIWFSMRKYSYPYLEGSVFEDRRVFFMLAVGMVFGTVLVTLERFLYPWFSYDEGIYFLFFILIFVIGFVFLEDLAKFVVLNWKGYQGRFDSVFYGISFGAGFAATAMVGYIYVGLNQTDVTTTASEWSGLVLLSICVSLIHATVGANLGYATAKNYGLRGIPMAILPHIIFNLLMFLWFLGYPYTWVFLAIGTPLCIYFFRGVYLYTIPAILPEEIVKEIRRKSRGPQRRRV
jgi:RsiW-degrading membrane proteinase PrsW (M82 family)